MNRDLIALQSFLRWCRDHKDIQVPQPRIVKQKEPSGRMRWLSADEIQRAEGSCPPAWWPLFATLLFTGMRIGEGQGLLWGDVSLSARRISINEASRRVKTESSNREVPISSDLAPVLAQHAASTPSNPADPVFPGPLGSYDLARSIWRRTCVLAGLHDGGKKPKPNATIHDLRHTFGVASARAGIPLVRIQYLMGHASPHMTLRYMMHAPEAFFEQDAESIASVLRGSNDRETASRTGLARQALRTA